MDYLPAPPERARLRPVNPLSIAVAVVLLAAGGAFGWRMRHGVPSARPTPEAAAAALALERVDGAPMCAARGPEDVRDEVLRGDEGGAPPERLSDYLPKRSPLSGYDKVGSHHIDPAAETQFVSGSVDGHVVSFRPAGEGGFDVYAYRFLTRRAAADAIADNVTRRICEFDAVPLSARGRPGMVVVEERRAEWSSAWWLTGSDVLVVRYGGWGDAKTSLANLAAIAGATALF